MAAASSQQLLQQQQQHQQQQNGQVIGLSHDTELDAKMFVVKKTNDSQGITALISRQLQGKNNAVFKSLTLIVACTGRMRGSVSIDTHPISVILCGSTFWRFIFFNFLTQSAHATLDLLCTKFLYIFCKTICAALLCAY